MTTNNYEVLADTALSILRLKFTEQLMNEGKQVHFVKLNQKDPNELGFQNFTKLLHNSTPLTFSDLLEKKLTLL